MPDQTKNASERPDLRRERVVFAPSTDYIYVYDRTDGSWSAWESADDGRDGIGYDTEQLPDDTGPIYDPELYPHPEKVRADAAEKKLAEVRPLYYAAVKVLAAHLDCVKELERERDEARREARVQADHFAGELSSTRAQLAHVSSELRAQAAKLDQVRADIDRDGVGSLGEAIGLALGDAYAGETFSDPTFERGTEAILGVLRERLAEPVTDREEPCDCQPFDFCPKCCTPESQEETRIRQLAYCEASVQASADPEDGEQCRELREHGSIYCKAHGGGPDWDSVADTYRISEDHEEPAGRVVTGLAMVDACDRCTGSKASEEPAGETKSRTAIAPSPMDCGAVHPESGERCVLWHSDGTPHETADGRVWEDRRQADSEAQR